MGRVHVGRFLIEAQVGGGGMGKVYRARDPDTGSLVAVKIIRDLSDADMRRFQRETRALAGLRHPGIVRYVAHGTTPDGEVYLAMEWLEGEDLRSRLSRTGITIGETITLARKAAEALGAVHAQGLVHRDVKPANLFLVGGKVEQVHLIDLGLVRGIDASAELTRTGAALGTPAFMSPEQARGERDIDGRSDLFSLGCVLFKCLTGRAPFEGSGIMAMLAKMLLEEVPRARSIRPEIPQALDDLIAKLTQKEPADRFQSARELVDALDKITVAEGGTPIFTAPSLRSPALTTGEQRVLTMVLVGARAAHGDGETPAPETLPGDLSSRIASVIAEHRGRVDRLLDGARIVTFAGASLASDQAARAVECALAIRALWPRVPIAVATEWSQTQDSGPEGGAIERAVTLLAQSARAVLRDAMDPSQEPFASPHPPDVAARAEAPPPSDGQPLSTSAVAVQSSRGQVGRASSAIALDRVTAALLAGRFDVEEQAGELTLLAARDLIGGARTLLGKPAPFVGRDWEMSAILRLFHESVEEPVARAVLVTAPAGMGKSRLAHEVVAAIQREHPGVVVWAARADSLRAGSPFALLGQALRIAAGIRQNEPAARRRARLLALVAAHVSPDARDRVAAFLGEIADAPFEDAATPELRAARADPSAMTAQLRAAFCELLAGVCATHPLVLVLEDLHWGDLPSVRILDGALSDLERAPWTILAFARPDVHEVFPRLWFERALQEVRLKPLTRKAAEQLIREALGPAVRPETVARIEAQAEGNAFYLEELVRAVAERGGSISDSFPDTVVAMAHARFEALDPSLRRMLRAASIFGDIFWLRGVEALLGGTTLTASVSDLLSARELVARRTTGRFEGEEELSFRHTMVREAAYATLTPADRALGHRLAAEWLEQHAESDAMLLAKHFELAGEAARAATYYLRAAAQSRSAFDLQACIDRAHLAFTLGPTEEDKLAAAEILADAHVWRFEWALALPFIETILVLTEPGGATFCAALSYKLTAAHLLARTSEMLDAIQTALGLTPKCEADVPMAVQAMAAGVMTLCLLGRRDTARELLSRIDALAAARHETDALVRGHSELAHAYMHAWGGDDPWAGFEHASRARAAFLAIGDMRNAMYAGVYEAQARARLGDVAGAERELRETPRESLTILSMITDSNLVRVLLQAGKLDEARARLTAEPPAGPSGDRAPAELAEPGDRWLLGEIALKSGDPSAAEREIQKALESGGDVGPLDLPTARGVLAAARLALGRPHDALEASREAMTALARTGVYGYRHVEVHLVHAEALHATGALTAARVAIGTVRDLVIERAERIQDPALRRAYLEDLPENRRALALAATWLSGDSAAPPEA
ncbi:MAG: protein kinase [Polyangiaceae bacterium]